MGDPRTQAHVVGVNRTNQKSQVTISGGKAAQAACENVESIFPADNDFDGSGNLQHMPCLDHGRKADEKPGSGYSRSDQLERKIEWKADAIVLFGPVKGMFNICLVGAEMRRIKVGLEDTRRLLDKISIRRSEEPEGREMSCDHLEDKIEWKVGPITLAGPVNGTFVFFSAGGEHHRTNASCEEICRLLADLVALSNQEQEAQE